MVLSFVFSIVATAVLCMVLAFWRHTVALIRWHICLFASDPSMPPVNAGQ